MRTTVLLFLFLILVFCFSCEEQGLIVKCPDCTAEEPLETNLEIKLESSPYGRLTLVQIYEGNLEDSVLYSSYHTTRPSTALSVTINKKYTVTASYYISNNQYIAVDSATPKVKYDKDQCDEPCYYVYDKVVNLRLKYTK
jgi:hypothetical protein